MNIDGLTVVSPPTILISHTLTLVNYHIVRGNCNIIEGKYNIIYGDYNIIIGNNNNIRGNNNKIYGAYNCSVGFKNIFNIRGIFEQKRTLKKYLYPRVNGVQIKPGFTYIRKDIGQFGSLSQSGNSLIPTSSLETVESYQIRRHKKKK